MLPFDFYFGLFFLIGCIVLVFFIFLGFLRLIIELLELLDKYVVKKVGSWLIKTFYKNKDL